MGPPPDFNDTILDFPPKRDPKNSGVSITTRPSKTRALGSRNSDAKICASSLTRKLNSTLSRHAQRSQKGFIDGRDFIENVVALDLLARAFSYGFQRGDFRDLLRAILVFLDIKAAFPSLAWAFLWAVLEALGVPIGYRSFFPVLASWGPSGCAF